MITGIYEPWRGRRSAPQAAAVRLGVVRVRLGVAQDTNMYIPLPTRSREFSPRFRGVYRRAPVNWPHHTSLLLLPVVGNSVVAAHKCNSMRPSVVGLQAWLTATPLYTRMVHPNLEWKQTCLGMTFVRQRPFLRIYMPLPHGEDTFMGQKTFLSSSHLSNMAVLPYAPIFAAILFQLLGHCCHLQAKNPVDQNSAIFSELAADLSSDAVIVSPRATEHQRWQAYASPTYSVVVEVAVEEDVQRTVRVCLAGSDGSNGQIITSPGSLCE